MTQWALITGASAGIGREFARLFAADRCNLVLVARDERRLNQLAEELQTRHGIITKTLARDLADPSSPAQIFDACQGFPISTLVNNAGFGWQGPFAESDLRQSVGMLEVNIAALVKLTRLFLPGMVARRDGRILNVASTAAFQPGPFTAMYYASKAFVFSFSVALSEELRGTGVTVTTLCPGYTQTEFQDRANMNRSGKLPGRMTAEAVAKIGYRACLKGKSVIIPGLANKITSAISHRLPAGFAAKLVRRINGR